MIRYCVLCGRADHECPGGLWSGPGPKLRDRDGICRYCARAALRAFGESGVSEAVIQLRRPVRKTVDMAPLPSGTYLLDLDGELKRVE